MHTSKLYDIEGSMQSEFVYRLGSLLDMFHTTLQWNYIYLIILGPPLLNEQYIKLKKKRNRKIEREMFHTTLSGTERETCFILLFSGTIYA